MKASDGSISDNLLVDNWLQAIKMAPEYKWLEAGSGTNITVSGNTIMGCRDVAIEITATAGSGAIAPAGAHQQVRVVNNSIRHSTNPAIVITSTRGLELHRNTIKSPDNSLIKPWEATKYGRKEDPDRADYLHNVEDARTYPARPYKLPFIFSNSVGTRPVIGDPILRTELPCLQMPSTIV